MRTAAAAALFAAGIVVAGLTAVEAQTTTVTGGAEVGGRTFVTTPADSEKAKFLQFRDMPSGLLWQSMYFRASMDSFKTLQLFGRNLGQQDQDLSLRGNHPGFADVQLRWDRIPHVFSTNARFLGAEIAPGGVYTLPVPRPDTATLNHSPIAGPIKVRWDPVRSTVTLMPSPHWDFKAEYQHLDKNGYRPMGMAFGGSSTNSREINEPIDQTLHDLRLSQAYTQPHFQAMVSYAYSVFNNAFPSVTSDNPLSSVDSLRAGSARGRTALPPSNRAQTLTGTAALSLPRHTRVTGTLSYGSRSQNQAFIPVTINSKDQDSLTRAGYVFPTSLNGNVRTSLVNLTVSSRPIAPVSVSARYRSYGFKDKTLEASVPILVISDRTFSAGAERERFPYTRDNADISASLNADRMTGLHSLRLPLTLTAGYAWERMDRDSAVRNVPRLTEKTTRFSLDYDRLGWASARLSYTHGNRLGNEYHQNDASENPDARRFDQSDRTRNSWNLMLSVTPIDQVTLTGTYQVGRDTFPKSLYGVQRDNSNVIGAEVDVAPIPRFSIGGGYQRESYNNQFSSRYRTGSTDATLNNPTWNWVATNVDSTSTAFVSFSGILMPDRLDLSGMWQSSKSSFQMQAFNPATPTGGTAAQNASATASDFPTATQKFNALTLSLRYRVSADWSVTARYQSEQFTNFDFRTTELAPANGIHIFQGNDLLPFDAKYFTFLVSFRPSLLRLPRPAI